MIFESTHRNLSYADVEFNLHLLGENLCIKPIREVRLQGTSPFVCLSLKPGPHSGRRPHPSSLDGRGGAELSVAEQLLIITLNKKTQPLFSDCAFSRRGLSRWHVS